MKTNYGTGRQENHKEMGVKSKILLSKRKISYLRQNLYLLHPRYRGFDCVTEFADFIFNSGTPSRLMQTLFQTDFISL